jgi:predicted DNA-binding transcriptional regulator AlpA
MSQKLEFSRQEFIDAAVLLITTIAGRYYDTPEPIATLANRLSETAIPSTVTPEAVLTREEASKKLKFSVATIDRMRKAGQLVPIKSLLPGKVRFRESDVVAFIQKRR